MAGSRRQARTFALQVLYEVDLTSHDPAEVVRRHVEEANLPPETERFTRELIAGVLRNLPRIDAAIRRAAPAWPLEQMARIDRNILRLAIFEIMLDNKVPLKAAINEAVELAKEFGGENSARFVNGVLGAIASGPSGG